MKIVIILCLQERDAERRRQLRERARQLIAEARSGVKMSDMSLLDSSSAEKSKSGKASLAGGQQTAKCTHSATVNKHAMNECKALGHSRYMFIGINYNTKRSNWHAFNICRLLSSTHVRDSHISIMLSKGVLSNP